MKSKFYTFLLIFTFKNLLIASFDITNPTRCEKGMNSTMKELCCEALYKKVNAVYNRNCCEYPRLVIWGWQWALCCEECDVPRYEYDMGDKRCCHFSCCLKYLKAIGENPHIEGIDVEGLKFSFLISVYNNTKWSNVISNNVDMCNRQFRQDIPSIGNQTEAYENFWDCFEEVPNYLYEIIDCAYNGNFLSCPVYNENVYLCTEYKNYVQDCLVDGSE